MGLGCLYRNRASGQSKEDFLLSAESRKTGTLTKFFRQRHRYNQTSFCRIADYLHIMGKRNLHEEQVYAKMEPFCRETERALHVFLLNFCLNLLSKERRKTLSVDH